MALLLLTRGRPFLFVRESPALYRPRRPERTAFYRLLEAHFGEFALVHEEGFREKLLTWRHGGGISVYGRHLTLNAEGEPGHCTGMRSRRGWLTWPATRCVPRPRSTV